VSQNIGHKVQKRTDVFTAFENLCVIIANFLGSCGK